MRKLKAAASSQHKKDEAWRVLFFFSWEKEVWAQFPGSLDLSWVDEESAACCVWANVWSSFPEPEQATNISHICHVFRHMWPPLQTDMQVLQLFQNIFFFYFLFFYFFYPLARDAVYISRESNKRSARFALPKFPHHFFSVTPQLSCFSTWHFHPIFQAQPGFPSPLPPGQQRLSSSLVSPRSESCP